MSHTSGIVFGVVLLLFVVSILGEINPDLGMPGVGNSEATRSTMDTQTGSQAADTRSLVDGTTSLIGENGKSLKVSLDGNSGTGYIWEVVTSQTSSLLQTSAITQEGNLNSMPGAEVTYALTVVPEAVGTHILTLRNYKPLAPTDNPTFKTFVIDVSSRKELHLETGTTTHSISGLVAREIPLSLDGNISTGCIWAVIEGTSPSLRTGRLRRKPSTSNPDGMVGAGEQYSLKVVPTEAGTHMLKLRYARPWDPTDDPIFKDVLINVAPQRN